MLILETKELLLREFTDDDYSHWHEILSDPEAMIYYPAPFTPEKIREWVDWTKDNYERYGFGLWAVILKSTGEFLGDCGITMQNIWEDGERYPEIGYHIVRKHQNRGYASEAASACVRYAFEQLGMSEVYSKQRSDNEASRRVALNAGMSLRREYTAGNGVGKSIYSIKKDEYFGKQS